ncbi:putative DsbA family dithiol-disulfide isomerase [Nonomuraea africana]|uniref:DsbA family dithiol-disulfide isomerase n=1 Tax=Nonomuraea africana TaxID=46171 RepID=A0ABR9K9M8_9ACTN|nr:putative DsbA family dithiol-disulfide isomerase [Nonomuraea africana]
MVCPWCYIGHRRFARAAARYAGEVEVTYRPFELNPGAPAEGEPLLEALQRKFGGDVSQMTSRVTAVGAAEGLEFHFDRAVSASSFEAHRLIEVAARQGLGAEMTERLFAAHFTDGLNIADTGVLAKLAAEVGVSDTGEAGDEVREQLGRARELGITSVPFFLFEGEFGVSGAQPEETFLAALEEVAERTTR